MLERQKLRMVPQVPFPNGAGLVPLGLEQLRDEHFVIVNPVLRSRTQGAMDADPIGIATRKQACARGGADRLRGMEIGEPYPLACDRIDVGGLPSLLSVATQIPEPKIIGEDQNDIR
jgi:hypothetical protein